MLLFSSSFFLFYFFACHEPSSKLVTNCPVRVKGYIYKIAKKQSEFIHTTRKSSVLLLYNESL